MILSESMACNLETRVRGTGHFAPPCIGFDDLLTLRTHQENTPTYDGIVSDGILLSKDPIGYAGGDLNVHNYDECGIVVDSVECAQTLHMHRPSRLCLRRYDSWSPCREANRDQTSM
jgi:hypothetical protein